MTITLPRTDLPIYQEGITHNLPADIYGDDMKTPILIPNNMIYR